jgi:rare lipoprotein A
LPAALACAFSAVTAVPAAADVFDERLTEILRDRQSGTFVQRSTSSRISGDEAAPARRTRVARATISDDEDYVAPRRAVRRPAAEQRPSPRARHRVAVHHRGDIATERAARGERRPAWTRRSLSSSGSSGSVLRGVASYYWQPQRVASGGWFNPNAMTAAHKTLPFGTRVRVTHGRTGRSVDVVINDRGPYIAGRIIDLSRAAANVIGMTAQGIAGVTVQILGRR